MEVHLLHQFGGQNPLAEQLREYLAQEDLERFRAITSYVKEAGLVLIKDPLLDFLDRGGRSEWVITTEHGLTTAAALRLLNEWEERFEPPRFRALNFRSPGTSFHPKVYIFEFPDRVIAIVGSSNVTEGGLWTNLEASIRINADRQEDGALVHALDELWNSYTRPMEPFSGAHITGVGIRLIQQIEQTFGTEVRQPRLDPLLQGLPRPNIRRPGTALRIRRPSAPRRASGRTIVLVMDVLTETRETQVQIPVDVLRNFFAINTNQEATITLRYVRGGRELTERRRPIVHLPHNNTHRIEIEAIRGLPRPLVGVFERIPGTRRTFAYQLFVKGTAEFRQLNQLLDQQGTRTRQGARRYVLRRDLPWVASAQTP